MRNLDILLKGYKVAKSLGLNNQIAHIWAKRNLMLYSDAFEYNLHCGCNVERVANIIGVEPILLDAVVTASYQKTGSGESTLICLLNRQISIYEFMDWFDKYYLILKKGIKSQKKWACYLAITNPILKKPNEPNWVWKYRRYSEYRRYWEFNGISRELFAPSYSMNKETGWR